MTFVCGMLAHTKHWGFSICNLLSLVAWCIEQYLNWFEIVYNRICSEYNCSIMYLRSYLQGNLYYRLFNNFLSADRFCLFVCFVKQTNKHTNKNTNIWGTWIWITISCLDFSLGIMHLNHIQGFFFHKQKCHLKYLGES